MKTEWQRRKRRFNGELGLTQYMRERQRERDRERIHRRLYSKNALTQYTCVCSMNTFYTSPRRTDRSTIVLQCSLKSSTLTPKIYSLRNILHNGLPVLCTELAFLRTSLRTGLRTRPNRSVPTDPVLGFFSRSGRCWACLLIGVICRAPFILHGVMVAEVWNGCLGH